MSIQRQNQKAQNKILFLFFAYTNKARSGYFLVTKRENKGRITPWVGKLADDAQKLRKLSAFFKED